MKASRSQFVTLCGRIFRDTDSSYYPRVHYRGRPLHLCTQVCLDAFLADPERFHRAHRNSEKYKGPITKGDAPDVA